MADQIVRTRVEADVSSYQQGMDDAARATEQFRQEAESATRPISGLQSVIQSLSSASGGLAGGLPALTTVLGVVSASGLAAASGVLSLATNAARAAEHTGRMAEAIGIGAREMSEYEYAARVAGVSAGTLESGLSLLSEAIESDSVALRAMGVETRSVTGQIRPFSEILPEVVRRLETYADGTSKSALGNAVFGGSFDDLKPLLDRGTAGLSELTSEASRFGAVISDEAAAEARGFHEDMRRIQEMLPALAVEIGGPLVSSVRELASEFLDARRAGLSFWEAVQGIGLSNPYKSHGEQITDLRTQLDRVNRVASPFERLGADAPSYLLAQRRQLESLIDYHKRRQLAEAESAISAENLSALDLRMMRTNGERAKKDADIAAERLKADQDAERRRKEAARQRDQDARAAAAAQERSSAQYAKLVNQLSGLDGGFDQQLIALHRQFDEGRLTVDAYREAVEALISRQPFARDLARETAEAEKEAASARTARVNSLASAADAEMRRTASLLEGVERGREEIQTLGMGAEALSLYTARKLEAVAAADDQAAAELEAAAALLEQSDVLPEVADGYRRLAAERRRAAEAGRAAATVEVEAGSARAAAAAEREWSRTASQIEGAIYDAIISGGNDASEVLERTFKSLILRPIIQPIAELGSSLVMGVLETATGGLLGSAGGSRGAAGIGGASNLYSLYSAGSNLYSSASALYGYASGTMSGGNALGSIYANYTGTGIDGLLGTNNAYGTAAQGAAGTGVSTLGSLGAGLAGGLWAYNQTGSYTAGVAGAAGSTALYGAAAGYMSGAGAAAGVSGALGTLGPYGWIALAVVAILGDIFSEEPDPRLTYQMAKDLKGSIFEDQVSPEAAQSFLSPEQYAEWQKTYADTEGVPLQAVAKGAFGYVGLHSYSKDVDAKDLKQQFEALAALDNAIASGLNPEEIEAVRDRMDGWVSSYGTRRDQNAALEERLWAIIEGIGGDVETDLRAFDASATNTVIEKLRTKWLDEQQRALDRLEATNQSVVDYYATLGADEGARAEIARRTAEIDKAKSMSADEWLAYVRTWESDRITATMLANPDSNGSWGMRNPEYDGDQSASMQQLIERLMKVIFIDDLQEGLGKMGQTIGKDAALAWMDAASFSVQATDANGQQVTTELSGFAAVAAQLEQVHALLYARPLDAITAQWRALDSMFQEIGEKTVPTSVEAFRDMLEAIDLNTEAGREMYLALAAAAPQVAALQEALLGSIGTGRDALLGIIGAGMGGQSTEEEVARGLNAAVTAGIRAAMTAEVANQVTDLMIGGIINPAIEAMVMGGDLSQALSASSIDAAVAEIEARAAGLQAVMSSPLVVDSLASISAAMDRIGAAVGRVGEASREAEESAARQAAQIQRAESALRDAYQRESAELQRNVALFSGFSEALRSFRESLLISDSSPLSPDARQREATRLFEDVARRARLGDTSAIESLQDVSQRYLDVSRESAASAEDYYRSFALVVGTLQDSETVAERHARIAQSQLDAMTSQVSALITLNDSVLSVRDAIAALFEARGESGAAIATGGGSLWTPAPGGGVWQTSESVMHHLRQRAGASATDRAIAYAAQSPAFAKLYATGTYGGMTLDEAAQYFSATNNDPNIKAYADGGFHSGGLRMVGERGRELEVTGPARYWSFEDTQALLGGTGGDSMAAVMRVMAEQISRLGVQIENLRTAAEASAVNTRGIHRQLQRWDGDGLPEERAA